MSGSERAAGATVGPQSANEQTDDRASPQARLAAGMLQVERVLHIGTPEKMESLVDAFIKSETTPSLRTSPEDHYVDGRVAAEKKKHGRTSTSPADSLCAFIDQQSDADLETLLAGATPVQITALGNATSNRSDQDAGRRTAARIFLALPISAVATLTPGQNLTCGSFDALSTPREWQRLHAALAALPPDVRLVVIARQSEAVQTRLAAIDKTMTVGRATTLDAGAEAYLIDAIMRSGEGANPSDPQTIAKRCGALAPATREQILVDVVKPGTPLAAWATHFILPLPDGERRRWIAPLVELYRTEGTVAMYAPLDFAPQFQTMFSELTPAQRTVVDATLAANNPELAKQLGIPIPQSSPASSVGGLFHETEAVTAPLMTEDHGFLDDGHGNIDEHKRRKPTIADRESKLLWEARLAAAERLRPDLVDATRAYRHFLDATGTPLELDYQKYVREDASGQDLLAKVVQQMRLDAAAADDADHGRRDRFELESGVMDVGSGQYFYPSTENWQKAIGAHHAWAEAAVQVVRARGQRTFTVNLTLHMQDRYNFNPGALDIETQTPDAENGRFEITGLGKEFITFGTAKDTVTFVTAAAPAEPETKPRRAAESEHGAHAHED